MTSTQPITLFPYTTLFRSIVEDMVEEEELVESKFKNMDDQDDIHTTYKKDRKSTRLNSSHCVTSRMPSSA